MFKTLIETIGEKIRGTLPQGRFVTLAMRDFPSTTFEAVDADGWIVTKVSTMSGSTYLVRPEECPSLTDPYIVPGFLVGKPTDKSVSLKGNIYNTKHIDNGDYRPTNLLSVIKVEKKEDKALSSNRPK